MCVCVCAWLRECVSFYCILIRSLCLCLGILAVIGELDGPGGGVLLANVNGFRRAAVERNGEGVLERLINVSKNKRKRVDATVSTDGEGARLGAGCGAQAHSSVADNLGSAGFRHARVLGHGERRGLPADVHLRVAHGARRDVCQQGNSSSNQHCAKPAIRTTTALHCPCLVCIVLVWFGVFFPLLLF